MKTSDQRAVQGLGRSTTNIYTDGRKAYKSNIQKLSYNS